MFDTIKVCIIGAVTALVAIFALIFKMRGDTIDELEKVVEVKSKEAEVTKKVTENKIAIVAFEATNKVKREEADAKNKEEFDNNFPIGKRIYI